MHDTCDSSSDGSFIDNDGALLKDGRGFSRLQINMNMIGSHRELVPSERGAIEA